MDARRRLPDLEPWHRYAPADATASDLETATLADYLRREDAVFRDVHDRIERTSAGSALPPANRYDRRSRSHPSRIGSDGNRTYEIVPDGEVVGGALLIHGLTDSPYSMRAVGETLKASGYYGLALRMPGHGTVPAALTTAVWEDWLAAVRVGVRHVRRADRPRQAARAGRLLERRRARAEVCAGRGRARRPSACHAPRADLADDRRRAVRLDVAGHQPARPDSVLREGAVARRHARVQPVQVQLLPRERRPAVVAAVDRGAGPDSPSRESRPSEGSAAGARIPVAGRRHRQHRRRGARALR